LAQAETTNASTTPMMRPILALPTFIVIKNHPWKLEVGSMPGSSTLSGSYGVGGGYGGVKFELPTVVPRH
jgi:hypothetical protein